MTVNQSVALRLEIERVNLLYKQNIQGVMALILFASAYASVCGSLMPVHVFNFWIFLVVASAILRIISTLLWNRIHSRISNLKQVGYWHHFIHAMLVVSGFIWGMAGWIGVSSNDSIQQILTNLTVVFMSAGAVVCWSPSRRAMFTFMAMAMIPWSLSYIFRDESIYQFIGILCLVYTALGAKAGLVLNRYIDRSLKLNVENLYLTENLQQEIIVKGQAEEALRLALSSSDAIEWSWNIGNDLFVCQGDLSRSFGLKTHYLAGNLDEMAHLFFPESQEKFRATMLRLALKGGDIDTDFKLFWPDGQTHDLAFRGKAHVSHRQKVTHLAGIAWDTTNQKSQAKLKQEKDIYEAANKAKSIFLANASHEIRTPLAAINGYIESLLQESHQNKNLTADLKAISRNGKFLTSLVNDFLDLSKIESGQFYMQKGAMSPQQEIEESLSLVKPSMELKGLSYEVLYETAIPMVIESDATRFRQILVNLLSNATKFTEQGKIIIRVAHKVNNQNQGSLSIRVIDTGFGIDDVTKNQLFEPFMRGQTLEIQRVYGSGLGLALSKNLAQALDGNLKLNSSVVGKGSEFEFTINTGPVRNLKFPNKTISSKSALQLNQLRILVVDDAIDLRLLMSRYLEKQGAIVETCENGLEALEKAQKSFFDLILMDIKMPVMDGHEATTILRKRGFKKPIIAITAHASSDDKQRSLEKGCDYYLSKPVDFVFLTETILKSQKCFHESLKNSPPEPIV